MARLLPPSPCIMTGERRVAFLLVLLAAALTPHCTAAAEEATISERQPRIRSIDRRLLGLLDEGARASPTFRALVDRLNASDVVVYLTCDRGAPARVDGRLTFLSSAGGFRYVVIRLAWLVARDRQLAIMA